MLSIYVLLLIIIIAVIVIAFRRLIRRRQRVPKPSLTSAQPATSSKVRVLINPERKQVQVATEEVSVPSGVVIKVKRSRTVEHTVAMDFHTSRNVEAGIEQIFKASIHGEIERTLGRTYQQSETIEYEVELNGERTNRYQLTWTDIWLTGESEMGEGKAMHRFPFQFRERSELKVSPLANKDSTMA